MNKKLQHDDGGFVLIASLLILLVLTVLGISVNRNTTTEWQIAVNDRLHKDAFYNADAATELAAEVLEQSLACLGFQENANGKRLLGAAGYDIYIDKDSLGFWRNYAPNGVSLPSDAARDLVFPATFTNGTFDENATNDQPHANINIGGNTKLTAGAAIQMAAGYEGVGKSLALGGAVLLYDINVQQVVKNNIGQNDSESVVCIQYGHVLGSEGTCNYP